MSHHRIFIVAHCPKTLPRRHNSYQKSLAFDILKTGRLIKIDKESQAYQQVLINTFSTLVSVISEITVTNSTVKTNTTPDDWRRLMFAI
jgi:hypothetical protein